MRSGNEKEQDGQQIFRYSLPEDGGLTDAHDRVLFIEGSALLSEQLRSYQIERPEQESEGTGQ